MRNVYNHVHSRLLILSMFSIYVDNEVRLGVLGRIVAHCVSDPSPWQAA